MFKGDFMVSMLATLVVLAEAIGTPAIPDTSDFGGVLPVWVTIIVGGGVAFAATAGFGAPSRRRRP
jgi:hypothetical protein